MSHPSFPSCHTIIVDRRDRCSHAKPFSLLDSWHHDAPSLRHWKKKENIPLSTSFARAVWLPSERNQYINFIIHPPPPPRNHWNYRVILHINHSSSWSIAIPEPHREPADEEENNIEYPFSWRQCHCLWLWYGSVFIVPWIQWSRVVSVRWTVCLEYCNVMMPGWVFLFFCWEKKYGWWWWFVLLIRVSDCRYRHESVWGGMGLCRAEELAVSFCSGNVEWTCCSVDL